MVEKLFKQCLYFLLTFVLCWCAVYCYLCATGVIWRLEDNVWESIQFFQYEALQQLFWYLFVLYFVVFYTVSLFLILIR